MTTKVIFAVLASAALALPGAASAAACKDAKGKFIKCPPAAAASPAPARSSAKNARPAKVAKSSSHKICRDKKGHFSKCTS
ncbi:MAG: hypothetical protein KGL48_15700 [Sphingomonadales bacterium]|nr:hypothetical protein [Sphingomonadales bacterium]MDE2567285.1 hypothetical protein [Sphingomonadales bacterium]